MAEQLLSSTVLPNNFPSLGDLKGLVVAAVLLSLLGHQTHVAGVTHRGPVELAVLSAILQASRVGAGVAAVGDDALDLLQLVVLVPHGAAVPHHAGHGGVDDDKLEEVK